MVLPESSQTAKRLRCSPPEQHKAAEGEFRQQFIYFEATLDSAPILVLPFAPIQATPKSGVVVWIETTTRAAVWLSAQP